MFNEFPQMAMIGLMAVSPVLADVVGVSVNGSINATAEVGYICGVARPCAGQVEASSSITLTGTDTALGGITKSGATSATDPVFGATDTLSMSVSQSASMPDPGVDYFVLGIDNIETPGGNTGTSGVLTSFWNANITNDISLTFTLTSDSVAFLFSLAPSPPPFSAMLLNSAGNAVFMFPNSPSGGTISLVAGTYQLVDNFTGGVGQFVASDLMVQANQISARFEPVPEPRWTAIPLLVVASLLLLRTKHRWLSW
jgi:hypothetical protein